LAACLAFAFVPDSFGQTSTLNSSNSIPFVGVVATTPVANSTGNPGVFTVYRYGNSTPALNVYYHIGGTASNGVDYQSISNFVSLPSGVMSSTIVINPINLGQTNVNTVVLDLCQSPSMAPVNYGIGLPSHAVVFITPAGVTDLPPVVRITSPPNCAVFRAPVNIPIFAFAADPDRSVASVEFFADGNSIGFGQQFTSVPPPGCVVPPIAAAAQTNFWELMWTNAPLGTNIALTAKATDNAGLSTLSTPTRISILPSLPPPTNTTPFVSIVANDPVAIEGTNCWPWLCLANATPTWSNWCSASAVFQWVTNCGPKNAGFTVYRFGATNDDLVVNYNIGGTATNGTDYIALSGTVLIPAGQCQASISVVPQDDGSPDLNSTVVLQIAPGTNYLVGCPAAAAAVILDSGSPCPTTGLLPGKLFNICSTGPDGAWFHIECSPDMVHWTSICTNQVINGRINFVDPDAPSQPTRFYRTVPESGPAQ
jgi:hypothetical protein